MNHRSAPIEVRESVAFENAYIRDALGRLSAYPSIQESVILSTCNRVEVVAVASDHLSAFEEIKTFFAAQRAHRSHDNLAELAEHIFSYHGADAVRHLFRVAASLDSMVVGEPQILGQLKDAYALAKEHGAMSGFLDLVLTRAFNVAKRVRTETDIGESAVSISYAAV